MHEIVSGVIFHFKTTVIQLAINYNIYSDIDSLLARSS